MSRRLKTTPLFSLPVIEAVETVCFLGAVGHVSDDVVYLFRMQEYFKASERWKKSITFILSHLLSRFH